MCSTYPPAPQLTAPQQNGDSAPQVSNTQPEEATYHDGSNGLSSAAALATGGLQMLQQATQPDASDTCGLNTAALGGHEYDASALGAAYGHSPTMPAPKLTRLRRACDLCSQRKVKCDENQPCKPCRELHIECTFARTMKRRGPPNKHAEAVRAAKQARTTTNGSGPWRLEIAAMAAQDDGNPGALLDAESIAPWPLLVLLVDDFFTYMHPLTPIPHEPTFRQSFINRDDRTNRGFLALLASMVGALVASFPRSARMHLKAQTSRLGSFPRAVTMVDRCRSIAMQARGPMHQQKAEVTANDAVTSYLLGVGAAQTRQWKLARRFFSESLTFARELTCLRHRDHGSCTAVAHPASALDHVQDQIGKRVFWAMLVTVRSMTQSGTCPAEVVFPPPTASFTYPDLPAEVDDQFILPHQIIDQPVGCSSLLAAFVHAINIYLTMDPVVRLDMYYGLNLETHYGLHTLTLVSQKAVVAECLYGVKKLRDSLPAELVLKRLDSPADVLWNELYGTNGFQYSPPAYPDGQPTTDIRHIIAHQPDRRRQLQSEIQKVNIHVAELATRSYYVALYSHLLQAHRQQASTHRAAAAAALAQTPGFPLGEPECHNKNASPPDTLGSASDSAPQQPPKQEPPTSQSDPQPLPEPIDATIASERCLIMLHLLDVLASVSQRSIEPNGASLLGKIRQIASTLLVRPDDDALPNPMVDPRASEALERLLETLMRLESHGAAGNATRSLLSGGGLAAVEMAGQAAMTSEEEEAEMRDWSELRHQQMALLQVLGG